MATSKPEESTGGSVPRLQAMEYLTWPSRPPTASHPATGPAIKPPSPTPVSNSSYVSQFSTSTPLILSRIKYGAQNINASLPGQSISVYQPSTGPFDLVRTRPAGGLSTTLAMPTTKTPGPSQPTLSQAATETLRLQNSLNPGAKRERESWAEDVDFKQNTVPFPMPHPATDGHSSLSAAQTPTGVAKGTDRCLKCNQSEWTRLNVIITCSRCSRSWHQRCTSPHVPAETTRKPNFRCTDCAIIDPRENTSTATPNQQSHSGIERLRQTNLSRLPSGAPPARPELVGFGAGHATDSSRTEYFYGKKKTDLLNILSFCDQLKPQLLVDIMVSVSKKHPDLPMFDSPDWQHRLLPDTVPKPTPQQRSRVHKRQRHGHTVVNSRNRHKAKEPGKPAKDGSGMKMEEGVIEVRDTLPPTWRKAGKGLYAKLPPEDEDKTFLADDNDEEAFSHFMVDKMGRQMMVSACA